MARAQQRTVGDDDDATPRTTGAPAPNPVWFKPVMVGFMLLGLVWILVFYLSGMQFPIPGIDAWNLVIGFGIAFIGFLMTTRWR
ncbi:cell division protein CrgA [Microbacterium marinilacus]|uniref:Cell division protein CrgA n=1 Tax=Microbacterium marinilacus TaxID=415209 RepID=A0ABP7BML2_9MICO|nr:cell division protein CrgA [Microbacterium marinilacus]MBY0688407.1 cell division protein CrgA [Microbacterium marinilacus]